jgi:hypothetical protein
MYICETELDWLSPGAIAPPILPSPRPEKNRKGDIVRIRSHRGSGERLISRDSLRVVSHMPQQLAAEALGLGNTRFKGVLRELGMPHWPYRTIRSLRGMCSVLEQAKFLFPNEQSVRAIISKLRVCERRIFIDPTIRLSSRSFRELRSGIYKLKSVISNECILT